MENHCPRLGQLGSRSNDDQKRCRRSFRRLTDSEDDESFDGDEIRSVVNRFLASALVPHLVLEIDELVQVLTALPEQKIAGV